MTWVLAPLLAVSLCIIPARVQAETWAWSSASAGFDTWTVENGTGDVVVKAGKIDGTLYDRAGNKRFTISGKISNSRVTLRVIIDASDSGPLELVGTYRKIRTDEFADSVGRDFMTLTDGFNFLGLTRNLKR